MMIEPEAEALAAKLTRIWMPTGSFGEGASWEWKDGEFGYTARLTDELEMWFGESALCEGRAFHLKRMKDGQTTALWYCPENGKHICSVEMPQEGDEDEEFARRIEIYTLRLMRSYCWLSGCPIEADAEEKERWADWQLDREAQGRGEPTHTPQWEVQRVAVALDVEAVTVHRNPAIVYYEGWIGDVRVTWELGDPNAELKNVYVGTGSYCGIYLLNGRWEWEQGQEGHEEMARGLYRLGIEEEAVLAALNRPLSAHERMELRLSMPREFWPLNWLGEMNVK